MTGTLPKFGDGTTIVVLGASGDLAKKKTVSIEPD
jgi:glucose-6-phosphate 1-dehydrogenase